MSGVESQISIEEFCIHHWEQMPDSSQGSQRLTPMHRNLGRLFPHFYCLCQGDSPRVEPTEPGLTPHYPTSVSLLKPKWFQQPHVTPVYRYSNTSAGPIVTFRVFFWFLSLFWRERGEEGMRVYKHKILSPLHCHNQLWLPYTTIGQTSQHYNLLFYH